MKRMSWACFSVKPGATVRAKICLYAACMSFPVCAQEEGADSLHLNGKQMHTVEVQADRLKWNNRTVASQTLIKEDVEKQGITDLADALRRMSGTTVRDYGGAGGMKTLSVRSMGATHTAVIYDGMAVTDCESGQIDLSRFSLEQVDRLTLVVGDNADIFVPARNLASAATLYLGSEAPFFREKGNHTEMRLSSGSFGYVNPRLKLEQRLGTSWSMRLQADYMRADNRYPFTLTNHFLVTTEKRTNNAVESGMAELNVYYRPASATRFQGKAYFYDNRKDLPGPVVYYNPENNESQHFRNAFGQIHFRTALSGGLSFQAHAKGNYAETHYRDRGLQYPGHVKRNVYRQQEHYASASVLYVPMSILSVSFSSDYAYTMLSSNAIDVRRPWRHTMLESIAVKLGTDVFTTTATLLAAIYKHGAEEGHGASDARRLSPSLAFAWHPVHGRFSLRASYKDIFRMPTFTDNYYTWMGNRNLRPEKARQLNVGATVTGVREGRMRPRVEVRTDIYYNKVRDKIVAMPMNMFFWNMVNVGKVDIMGTDAGVSLSLQPSGWLRTELTANYTYQYAVNVTSPSEKYYKDQIAYTPRHSGGGSLALLTPWMNVSIHGTGMSRRYSTNENMDITRLDAHHELGIAAWREFGWDGIGLTLRADVLNLTNEQYDVVRLYPMPGRSWKMTLILNI